jgi:hypothetical protein
MNSNLSTSDWRLWVMCVIIVGCLAFWLTAVFMAARAPGYRNPRTGIKGPVHGGRHIATGGRSVSPDRGQLAMESIPAAREEPYGEPQQIPSVPRPAQERDPSVPMPAQRAESPADNVQPINRP